MSEWPGLATALAARLAPHAPAGLELHAEAGALQARLDDARRDAFPVDEPELEPEIAPGTYDPPYPAFAVLEALDFVQEFVRGELGEEWGGEAWAELDEDEIRFGLGDQAFEPIPLSELGSGT